MFRTLVKTDALRRRRPDGRRSGTSSCGRMRGRAALQRGDPARARRSHHPRRRFGDEPRGARDAAGAGDGLQPAAGATSDGRLTTTPHAEASAPRRRSCRRRRRSARSGRSGERRRRGAALTSLES